MHKKTARRSILFFGALIFFAVAAFFSLYEGSQLDDVSWEWPHSAVFTNWLNGKVTSADDILTVDYLVYAAKFEPLFPIIMFISGLILFLQLAFWVFKGKKTALSVFLMVFAVMLLVFSGTLMASPTDGLQLFSRIFLGSAILIVASCIFWLIKERRLPY
ncbi:cytochrome b subunit of formate dehydrogenase [Planomicrobium stackebrandtii]|uniref:Cytochrome b subunit of formate dehydrogenase n=1 Tax=Planomicrobium stackebrandtii TaxID=253160 RepID=A0ABU0GT10_9BACL|nr:DUF4306 domain-containing protein [Planomicrobium stackebrandtii]MDQ0428494.1 cytochrome b subunit of formate dehydrogenase [Planomicrobium stackebrandtii]